MHDENESYEDEPTADDVEAVMDQSAPVEYTVEPTPEEVIEYRSVHGGSVYDCYKAVLKHKMRVLARYARENDDLDAMYAIVEAMIENM